MRGLISLLVVIVVLGVGVAFALDNTEQVAMKLFALQLAPRSLGIWVLAAFLFGSLFGLLCSAGLFLRVKKSEYSVKRKLAQSEKELDHLRPVKDTSTAET